MIDKLGPRRKYKITYADMDELIEVTHYIQEVYDRLRIDKSKRQVEVHELIDWLMTLQNTLDGMLLPDEEMLDEIKARLNMLTAGENNE